jgi:hypothetical protein
VGVTGFSITLPPEVVEAIAARASEIALARLDDRGAEAWPEWMRLPTAARYLDVSADALRNLVARRKVAYSQEGQGCAIWFRRGDLDEFLLRSRREPRGGMR